MNESSVLHDILKCRRVAVNSIHEVVINRNHVRGCFVFTVCPGDNTACAIEFRDKRFALGVKFHSKFACDGGRILDLLKIKDDMDKFSFLKGLI